MTSMLPMKKPLESPRYSFLEDPIDDTTHIVIETGDAAGVVFRYGKLRFAEGGDNLNVRFNYHVVRNPNLLTDTVLKSIIISILDDILKREADPNQELHGQN